MASLPYVTDVDTLRTMIRRKVVRVVDVRKAEEYQKEHIKSAVSIPLSLMIESESPEKTVEIIGRVGIGDSTAVMVYDNTFGAIAARVACTFHSIRHLKSTLLEVTFDK